MTKSGGRPSHNSLSGALHGRIKDTEKKIDTQKVGGLGVGTRDPRHGVRGSICKKKLLHDPGPNTHTTGTIRKEVLSPPQKRCIQVQGYGGQNPKKNYWGYDFGPKMMNLQEVRQHKPYVGVCYAKDPKRGGGYTMPATVLNLKKPLFEVIWMCRMRCSTVCVCAPCIRACKQAGTPSSMRQPPDQEIVLLHCCSQTHGAAIASAGCRTSQPGSA